MSVFSPYVDHLASLVELAGTTESASIDSDIRAALDGQPNSYLRLHASLGLRRSSGAFFTGSELRQLVMSETATVNETSRIFDPACGVGDLLLPYAEGLPVGADLATTINMWGKCLFGTDIHPEFVRAAKARLILCALRRGVRPSAEPMPCIDGVFPGIRSGNGLSDCAAVSSASFVILNPPYGMADTPEWCQWTTGRVSSAALFLDFSVTHAVPGTNIVAILPDVIRTGTRYEKLRKRIESMGTIHSIDTIGQFDPWTDIDVFILRLSRSSEAGQGSPMWWQRPESTGCTIGERFEISVGSVVPHRHQNRGHWYRYIYARLISGMEAYDADGAHSIRFRGNTVTPPFVVVRRTTRPDRDHRAVATLVTGTKAVAVENHLIVLKPRNGGVTECMKLLNMLSSDQTKKWLNQRIRCRHFTVSSLRDLPWRNEEP